jgi:hypothetical protein
MAISSLTKQYILDASGVPIGVILPIEDYQALITAKSKRVMKKPEAFQSPLFGALRYLGGAVAPTEEIDSTLKEMWSTWNDEQP